MPKMRLKGAQICPKMPKQGLGVPKGVQNKVKGCPKVPKIRSRVAQNGEVPKCVPKKGNWGPKCSCAQNMPKIKSRDPQNVVVLKHDPKLILLGIVEGTNI